MRSIFQRPAPDRRAVGIEQYLLNEQSPTGNSTQPPRDPSGALGAARRSLAQGSFPVFGRIVDAVAYTRTYKVQCERGLGTLKCCDTAATGLGVVGARQLNTYPPGTGVIVLYHPQALHHLILCSVPDWMASPTDALSDYIVQGSNCGLQVDQAHKFPFSMPKNGIIDFSAGRPSDSLHAGEWGAMSELGIRILLDSMHAQVAVDETTGMIVVYLDRYARYSGHNLDLRSAGWNREDRDDEGEFRSVHGFTPYLWEAMGVYSAGTDPLAENTSQACQQDAPHRARLEPVEDRQLGVYREREFHGYLGQGGKQQIVVPVPGATTHHTYDSPASSLVGLSEQNRGLDGELAYRSSRGIFLAKMPLIPSPKERQLPESQLGDRTDDAYASCGQFGEGQAHDIAAGPAEAEAEEDEEANPHVIEPAVILDLLAYAFNWKGLHPFHYHSKDWYLSQESEMTAADSMEVPPFADLAGQTFLPQASSFSLKVDDRYGLVKYYANISCLALLPNGGISQFDGWGVEQRSAGGTQYFNAPGDIVLNAGRNIILQAGRDVILKALNCIDESATNGSVRVLAGANVQILGGNNGCGGVLIESRSAGPAFVLAENVQLEDDEPASEDIIGGIVLRSRNSDIVCLSHGITLSTAAWGSAAAGHIVIDAGDLANIAARADSFRRHINSAIDFMGDDPVINEFWAGSTILGGSLRAYGDVLALGDLVASAHVIAGAAVAAPDYEDLSAAQASALAAAINTADNRDLSAVGDDSLRLVTWMVDHGDVAALEFYFRDAAGYGTEDFTIHEPLWAQLARMGTGSVPGVWIEQPAVGVSHDDSAPYPGLSVWRDSIVYGQQDLRFFDPVAMLAADRGADYEESQLAATTWVSLEGNWPIVG